MPKAMVVHAIGGPEALQWEDVSAPTPGEGEVLIKQSAIGLNYIDVYYRNGTYAAPQLPFTPGFEGCGVVIRTGPGVKLLNVGDRVAYAKGPIGAYSEYRAIHQENLVRVPHDLADQQVAGVLLRGLTAHYLVCRTYRVHKGAIALVYGAAGGTGGLVAQWCHHIGATVIGVVGRAEKKELATTFGCDLVIDSSSENIVERVKDFTKGAGVHVVYDAIGKDTFEASLDCLMPFGMFVSYGQSSGPVPPVDLSELQRRGSLFMTRPSLFHYKRDTEEYQLSAATVFDMILRRHLRVHVMQTYNLEDAAYAHQQLESRQTQGPSVLVVGKQS
jgi:NADPH2:quinone reductase